MGEIEQAVYKQPGIKTTTAVVLSGALIVFALVDDRELKPEDVMKTCAKWLPKFMVPSDIVALQKFPYLPSGKVDKRKLEADYQRRLDKNAYEGDFSTTPTALMVEEMLRDVLGPFARRTRLAAAGLDSLVAIRVATKLRSSGFEITTLAVLQVDTLGELIKLCESSNLALLEKPRTKPVFARGNVIPVLNGNAKDLEYTMPCTPVQSAMLSETAAQEKAYRNWVELDLPGISDSDQVTSALEALAQHNPILRTGFAESQDYYGFMQMVWNALANWQIEKVKDFTYNFDTDRHSSLHHPLWIQIQHLGSSIRLLIHFHHAQYDAWSLELLLDDLNTISGGQSPPSRPPFATLVESYLEGTLVTDSWTSIEYWKDHLAYLDTPTGPNFHNSTAAWAGLAVAKLDTGIPTSDVDATARRLSSSPQSLFQAAYALILGSYLGSSDICFGTVFSGRTLPVAGIEDVVGPCLATLPVRVDVSTSMTLRDLVQDLNATNRKHLEHSTIPLREIKSASGVHPRQPLFCFLHGSRPCTAMTILGNMCLWLNLWTTRNSI